MLRIRMIDKIVKISLFVYKIRSCLRKKCVKNKL